MQYIKDYELLNRIYTPEADCIEIPDSAISIHNIPFTSAGLTPVKEESIYSRVSRIIKDKLFSPFLELQESDEEVNKDFHYILFKPAKAQKADEYLIMLHGLNERAWSKYLPWAKHMAELTGKAVILFPIAYHMNRSPKQWTDLRSMFAVSKQRQNYYDDLTNTSFANTALSIRLQYAPENFFFSGFNTYLDLIQLAQNIAKGEHAHIKEGAKVDFFGYSIGAFLTSILMMASPDQLFDQSKAFLFCGGSTLDGMFPASKKILDNVATQFINQYYNLEFKHDLMTNETLARAFETSGQGGHFFKSMLSSEREFETRENRMKELQDRIVINSMMKDLVAPPQNINKVAHGIKTRLHILHEVLNPSYPYEHEDPFPVDKIYAQQVEKTYKQVIQNASAHLY